MARVGRKSDDDRAYNLYTLRKTFGRRAALGGMDLAELAAVMGHEPASIPMLLERYYRPSAEQLSAAHAAARPADSLHEWRADPHREARLAGPSLTFFARAAAGEIARGGKSPASLPSSRSRTKGA